MYVGEDLAYVVMIGERTYICAREDFVTRDRVPSS